MKKLLAPAVLLALSSAAVSAQAPTTTSTQMPAAPGRRPRPPLPASWANTSPKSMPSVRS